MFLDAKLSYNFLPKEGEEQPRGYMAKRYVLARNAPDAFSRAKKLERRLIEKEWAAVKNGSVSILFEHDEIEVVSALRLLRRRYGRGFYETD